MLHGLTIPNHPSVQRDYPLATELWLTDQLEKGMLVGPLKRSELPWTSVSTIPLHSVAKDEKMGTRRFCADGSHVPRGVPFGRGSLNQGIMKGQYLGKPFDYNLPSISEIVSNAIEIGLDNVLGFKVDWSHAYRQNSICP